MAKIAEIICVTHNPFLPRVLANAESHEGLKKVRSKFGEMRQKMTDAKPDVLLVIANDHVNQWFSDNIPAFLVGKSPVAEGPFDYEESDWAVPHYSASIDVQLAKSIIRGGFDAGVDFAFSDEFTMDHAFTVPMTFIRPEADLPIVPVFTNVMLPPLPPVSRFYHVGEVLRDIVEAMPSGLRVGVISSGHLSVEVGGPRMLRAMGTGAIDPEFDAWAVGILGKGGSDSIVREVTMERMSNAGNFTAGYLNFVMAAGLARGKPASQAECIFSNTAGAPFVTWDEPV